jgi:hypothetical protein
LLCNPLTVIGDDALDAVNPPGELVTVKDAVGPPNADAVNATEAEPLLYGLDAMFVAALTIGGPGKSTLRAIRLCPCTEFLLRIMYYS